MTVIIQKTIALDDIAESPTNPRKHFDDAELAELAASIKEKGVLQPVLVRRRDERPAGSPYYELVAGARRYRASKIAGLTEIPAVIREMTDAEVLEAQVIENNQRRDVHPLEEADGFAALAADHGHTAETIAAKIGRSTSYVYQRLKLAGLSSSARKACFAGKLTTAAALVLARLPEAELQEHAFADIMKRSTGGDEPFDLWVVKNVVQHNYTLRIAEAQFDTTDPDLLPSAGSCTKCPKRTGAQAELFAEMDKDDRCTDVKCFGTKKEASWAIRAAAARKKGLDVFEGKGAKELFSYGSGLRHGSPYIDLDEVLYDDNDEAKSWRERIGKQSLKVTLARDEAGGVHELVLAADAFEHVKASKGRDIFAFGELSNIVDELAAPEGQPERDAGDDDDWRSDSRRKRAIEDATVTATTTELVAAVEKGGVKGKDAWLAFLAAVEEFANEERIAERRGLPTEGFSSLPHHRSKDSDSFVRRIAASMSEKQVAALVVEILSDTYNRRASEAFCKAFGVDRTAIEERVAKELEQKNKPAAKSKRKAVR
jgi:ParB/RepB/Spo0J family partition protein